jgi:hypothetical protein
MRMFAVAGLGLGFATVTAPATWADDVIKTLSALYGTPSEQRTCDATAAVADACDGKKSCDVRAGNSLCGDPNIGTPKTLDVEYQCGPAVAKSLTASEQRDAHLSCE